MIHVHMGKHHIGHGCEIDAGGLQSLRQPPEPAVLLAAERARRHVVDTMVIYMGHSGLSSHREHRGG